MEGGALNVKWKSHSSNLYTQLDCLYYDQNLVDVTLSCNDGIIKAHRLVLSVCSPYFESLFKDNQHRHPIVILKGVSRCELENVITFMYKGSVKVLQNEFESFMILASELKVRGLSEEPDFKQKILTSDCIQHDTLEGISNEPVKQPEKIVKKRGRPRKHNIPTEGVEQSKSMINTNNRRSNMEAHNMEIVTADPLLKDNMDEFWDSIKKEIETEPEDQSCSSNKATFSEDGKDMSIASPEERTSPELNSHSFNTRFKGQKRVNVGTRALSLGSIKRKDSSIKKRRVRYSSSNDGLYSSDANSSRQAPPSEELTHEVTPDLHWQVSTLMETKKWICEICLKDCGSEESLTQHHLSHSEEKVNMCDVCNQTFTRSSHLARHKRVHTGERPFACPACELCFSRRDKLKQHYQRYHSTGEAVGKRPYKMKNPLNIAHTAITTAPSAISPTLISGSDSCTAPFGDTSLLSALSLGQQRYENTAGGNSASTSKHCFDNPDISEQRLTQNYLDSGLVGLDLFSLASQQHGDGFMWHSFLPLDIEVLRDNGIYGG
uniref:Uncharacterized protein n=1 Tax=Timema shepardi TaxID=629360 RepID=A0A7R9B551_TIMSH|nr:unnamed protein product [Timema shepardi]